MLSFECEDCIKELWNGICYEVIDSRLTHKIKVPFFVFGVTSIALIVKCKHLLPYDPEEVGSVHVSFILNCIFTLAFHSQ